MPRMAAEGGFSGVFWLSGVDQPPPTASTHPFSTEDQCAQAHCTTTAPRRLQGSWYEAGPLGVALYGEIYNAAELSRHLGLAPDEPLGQVLLTAWKRWSAGVLTRLNGVFALALRNGNEWLLYRDPSGLRNLYVYTGCPGQVAFATHLDTLFSLPGTERRLASRSVHEYLRCLDIAAPNTLFEDVHAVEAGQCLQGSASSGLAATWPVANTALAAPESFAQAVEMLDCSLQHSVERRLVDSARPAAFLSGGIDSALLCALASRARPDTTAVTVGFEGIAYDETPVAQRIAAHLGMAHEVLRFDRQAYLAAFERLVASLEQPMADPATLATLLVFEHCKSHYDTVIDGTGADEAIGAMPARHVRLAVAYASRVPTGLRRHLTRWLSATPGLSAYTPILDFEHPADTLMRWHGFTRAEIERLCGESVSFAHTTFYRTFQRFPRGAHYDRYSALLNAMPSDRLNQAMLISGMTVRFPFLDVETGGFIRQLRTDYRHLPAAPKRILRTLLARYVPQQIWQAPKHGFNFPLQAFLMADDAGLVRRHLDAGRWRASRLLSPALVQDCAQRFIAGDQRLTFRVWALVVLGAWLEKHRELHRTDA